MTSSRLLGLALIVGGLLVGGVIVVLMGSYGEMWSTAVAIAATIAALILLVLPQVALGVYLINHSASNNAQSPKDPP